MKLLIFDLDGTLIDSKRDIVLSVNRAFIQLGYPELSEEKIGDEIGRGSEYLFKRLLGKDSPDLVARFKEIYAHHLLDHTQIYPGIIEALTHYSAIPKVIVTNKNQVFSDRIVKALGLREHFEGVFGSEAFPTQKPHPGPILEVCKKWNVAPIETVIIGDSEFDITAGKAAGVKTVGALYGFSREETFRVNRPDFEINSADQLVGLFT
jgi:phosphoglycolate phosphatase